MKIVLLFDNYGPYHIARISAAYRNFQRCNWEVVGIELTRSSSEYAWRSQIHDLSFTIHTVSAGQKVNPKSFLSQALSLERILKAVDPDVLAIAGYSRPAMLFTLAWSRWRCKSAILFSESTEADFARSAWKERLKGWLLSQYQAALVGGQPQKRYLIKLGMSEIEISLGYNVVGNDAFSPTRIRTLPRPLTHPYFLAINRFIPKKNLTFLINAYAAYCQIVGDAAWDLVLCGDGELRPQLYQQIHTLSLEHKLHLPGFLQQSEILPYFAYAGCFVHSSTHEQWGLVVNEAMAAGLPVLVSNRCGCFEDLVLEGVNGFGFDPYDQQQLTDLMLKISSDAVERSSMGEASLQHIQKYSPDYFADGLKKAIDYALTHP